MEKEKIIKKAEWIYDYGWEVINPISVVIIGLTKVFFLDLGNWSYLILALGLVLYIPSIIYIIKGKKRISMLEEKIEKLSKEKEHFEKSVLNYQEGFENFINSYSAILFSKLGLTNKERISIYEHKGSHFSLLCRHSDNPEYSKKGRPVYPDDKGFIGNGYQNSPLIISKKISNPENDYGRYVQDILNLCDIDKETLDGLSMKSRSFLIYAIKNPITTKKIAVVVFESIKHEFKKQPEVEKIIPELEKQIVSYLSYTKQIRPELSFAKNQGL